MALKQIAQRRAALVMLALLAACRTLVPAAPPVAPCAAPPVDRTGWSLKDETDFSFSVPPQYESIPAQGIDSRVGRYSSPDGSESVWFDYGRYSNDLRLDSERMADYHACSEEIDGQLAYIVTYRVRDDLPAEQDRRYVAAATWRDLRPEMHLTVQGEARSPEALPRLLSVLRSVRFPDDSAGF